MAIKTLKVDIDEEGKITVTVEGIAGKSCEGLAQQFARALGGEVEETGHTADYVKATVTPTVQIKQS